MRLYAHFHHLLFTLILAILLEIAVCDPGFHSQEILAASLDTPDCGIGAPSASQRCGMGLCCSAAGFCGATNDYCSGSNCQQAFGQCRVAEVPICNAADASASGRTVGYWQSSNTQRSCDTVTPKQINTSGLTHLYYAFVTFDKTTFAIRDADPDTYRQFTARKSSSLETWVAVGGGDFGRDPWTKMTSSSAGRSAFISSLQAFTKKYGFVGVNIDWEFPAGADSQQLVALLKDLRFSFGPKFGISLTLPADLGAIRYFDAKAMEQYVDMFEFMAYDLNWGRKTIHGQTDIRDIEHQASALWASRISLSKVNLGLAYYGRGFTLQDATCSREGCPATGIIKDGPCTHSGAESVLSLEEIKKITASRGLSPSLVGQAMYKQIVWDNQWMGYDDEDTFSMKRAWASGKCFGGTMIWSMDFYNHGRV